MKLLAALLLLLPLFAFASVGGEEDEGDGQAYLELLSDSIRRADRIVVTEHSSAFDVDPNSGKPFTTEPFVYKTRELNRLQKVVFAKAVERVQIHTDNIFPHCIFDPHHSVYFYNGGKLLSRMQISFVCGQIEWSATDMTAPGSLQDRLQPFLRALGMEPNRDWPAVAKEHSKRQNTAAQERKALEPDKWPVTVDDTVADFISMLSEDDKDAIRKAGRDDLAQLHRSLGRGIRNYYGLWRGNDKLLISACGKPCSAERASGIIIRRVWEALKKPELTAGFV